MPQKIVLLCTMALIFVPPMRGLNEQVEQVFERYLEQGKFKEARALIDEQAFPDEKAHLLKQIDQAETTFKELEESQEVAKLAQESDIEDLVAKNRIKEAIDTLIQRGFPVGEAQAVVRAIQASPLPRAAHAGPASPRPSATEYAPLTPEQIEQVNAALAEDERDLALAIIVSADAKDAHGLLERMAYDYYGKQPRKPAQKMPAKGKELDLSGFIKEIKAALAEKNIEQAKKILSRIEKLSEGHAELVREITEARYLILAAEDEAKYTEEKTKAQEQALAAETIKEMSEKLAQANTLARTRSASPEELAQATTLYKEILARAPEVSDVYNKANMMLQLIQKRQQEIASATAAVPEPHPAPAAAPAKKPAAAPAPETRPAAPAPVMESWAAKLTVANTTAFRDPKKAIELYQEIIIKAPDKEMRERAFQQFSKNAANMAPEEAARLYRTIFFQAPDADIRDLAREQLRKITLERK